MLALEFDRVERLVEKLVDRADQLEESAKKASPLQRGLVVGAVAVGIAAFVAAALWWDLPVLPF
jgi:ferric-dicitrate binding protein FerR (iron transport regulator)